MLIKFTLFLLSIFSLNIAKAGTHAKLCDKVKKADIIFEMNFKTKGNYPAYYKKRKWAPPKKVLLKTAKTGVVTKVFKGNLELGSPWIKSYYFNFRHANSILNWNNFFKRNSFSQIYFLKKYKNRYQTTGEAEETASCKVNPQFSWCLKYSDYIHELEKCLRK